jgi:hypothetical protein
MGISKVGAVATGAVAAGLTAAAVALAVPPPPSSSFEGQTSQTKIDDHGVRVETDANGHVSRVTIGWRAKCKKKGQFWTATTVVNGGSDGLQQNGDVFSLKGSYTGNAGGGIKGKVTVNLQGAFTDNDNAKGTWSAKVVVRKKGKKIDSCKTPKVNWSVARA